MGVGGMAGGLEYGQRGIVESTAMVPSPTAGPVTGPISPPQGGPNLGMAVEPFAPTERPDQPITAGMEPDAMSAPNPADVLAAMYRRFPYPDLRRLLERAQMTDWNSMAGQGNMNTLRGFTSMAESPQGDSWMRQDGMRQRVTENTMGRIRDERTGGRFAGEGEDPDQTRMTPEQQAETERRMDDIRRNRSGGRFQ
jgi:hypothetical protein